MGFLADLGEMPALSYGPTPTGLGALGQVVDILVRYLTPDASPGSDQDGPEDPRSYLESLSWHTFPSTRAEAAVWLELSVIDRTANSVVLRLHGVDPAGQVTLAADLRCRRPPAAATRSGSGSGSGADDGPDPLRMPVTAGDSIRRSYPVEAHMLTHHIPDAAGVLMTPNLVALMEDTSADIVRPRLIPGAAAVGTWIGVRHTGAALSGQCLDVHAVVVRTGGRRITFDVTAYVGQRRIGDGQIGFTLLSPR